MILDLYSCVLPHNVKTGQMIMISNDLVVAGNNQIKTQGQIGYSRVH